MLPIDKQLIAQDCANDFVEQAVLESGHNMNINVNLSNFRLLVPTFYRFFEVARVSKGFYHNRSTVGSQLNLYQRCNNPFSLGAVIESSGDIP